MMNEQETATVVTALRIMRDALNREGVQFSNDWFGDENEPPTDNEISKLIDQLDAANEQKPVHQVIARLQQEFEDRENDQKAIESLDEIVHNGYSSVASAVNNEGIFGQIDAIIQTHGEEAGEKLIREALTK